MYRSDTSAGWGGTVPEGQWGSGPSRPRHTPRLRVSTSFTGSGFLVHVVTRVPPLHTRGGRVGGCGFV